MGDDGWHVGHRIKKRPQVPIISYGIILFTDSIGMTDVKYLLYRRRDTFEYIDFLRGCWCSEEHLPYLFSMMTPEERNRLRNHTLRELWDDLWVHHNCKIYVDGYPRAKRKYDSIAHRIKDLLDSTTSVIEHPPMGWPKGKKNNIRETPIDCAIREFTEETRIPLYRDAIWSDKPYIEKFRGGDGKLYQTYYYLAYTPVPILVGKISTPQCIRKETISEEASELHWFKYSDACLNLPPRRQIMLKRVMMDIEAEKPPRRSEHHHRPPGL